MAHNHNSDISGRIAAAIGIFPEGKKETKIIPIFDKPESIGDDELFLPYHDFWGFNPVDKKHLVEIDRIKGLLYQKDEKVKLQHYGYYTGNPAEYNNESALCSRLFLKCNQDYSEWVEEVKRLYGHEIQIYSCAFGKRDDASFNHRYNKSAIEELLSAQATTGGGEAISTTYSDIAEGVSKMDRKMGFDPINVLGTVLHSDGLYVFDLEIPAKNIIIPQHQITSRGGFSRLDNFILPESVNLDNEQIVADTGFFIYLNDSENEILFTHKIPPKYVVGFRYFPHNK